jgi:hypothetical protein
MRRFQARPGRPRRRQFPQRPPGQDGNHRGRAGGNLGAAGPDSSFDPKIVAKRQRRLTGVDGADDMVISESGTFWGGYGGGEQTRTGQPR